MDNAIVSGQDGHDYPETRFYPSFRGQSLLEKCKTSQNRNIEALKGLKVLLDDDDFPIVRCLDVPNWSRFK